VAADLTSMLERWRQGDEEAASELLSVVYADLRRIAGSYMRHERGHHTLQATALVHEAWMRLSSRGAPPSANRQEFFRAMAAYMRRHLIDHARRRSAAKRSADLVEPKTSDHPASDAPSIETDLSALDSALAALAQSHPRCARVLDLRFFGHRSIEETATELGVGTGTVKRDYVFARAFLSAKIAGPSRQL
jgi:RNA polymerase sigma factor (TIGR02999 family)